MLNMRTHVKVVYKEEECIKQRKTKVEAKREL